MELQNYVTKYKHARFLFYKWRYELAFIHKLALAASFACLTGLLAQVRFYLPFSPVPITGQTFAILLAGVLLGTWGGVSQLLYVGIGAAGVPWFAGGSSGLAYLTGPTGGYLIGFIIAAFFLGYCVDRYIKSRNFLTMFGLMCFANIVFIYGLGLLQLYGWFALVNITPVGFGELLFMGMIPFLIGDIIKIGVAAAITQGITPKRSYAKEIDARV